MAGVDTYAFIKILMGMSVGLFTITFWILMIKDCITKMEGYTRYTWILIIVLTFIFGAFAYFITARRKRIKNQGF